jgi:nicotinamidase-related amidase
MTSQFFADHEYHLLYVLKKRKKMSYPVLLDPNDAVMLLIDHQAGLFNLVKDMSARALRNNVAALAKVATMQKIPVITSASVPDGPNGPLIKEIKQYAPQAKFIERKGQINAWEIKEFVQAIKDTKRKSLIMAGTLTSVCLAFPALCAQKEGYRVYAVVDASGNWSKMATDLTIARLAQAGVTPIDTFAVIGELQKTWNRPDAMEYANIFADNVLPNYGFLMQSYDKAKGR